MNNNALELTDITKRYGKHVALNGLSLSVRRGEIFGLLGANGAGKSTTVRILCGLLAKDGGTGHCLGQPLGRAHPHIGYMPQRGSLYDDLTVQENLRFFAGAHGLADPLLIAVEVMKTHDLSARADQRVSHLSGGWRQRVAFAAALIHQPTLLILDEPTAGLDPQARNHLWREIRRLASIEGVSVLVTTHHALEAERCDRIGYLSAGRLEVAGQPQSLAQTLGLAAFELPVFEGLAPNSPQALVNQWPLAMNLEAFGEFDMSLEQHASGWRLVALASSGPAILALAQAHGMALAPATAALPDVLAWLARHPEPAAQSAA